MEALHERVYLSDTCLRLSLQSLGPFYLAGTLHLSCGTGAKGPRACSRPARRLCPQSPPTPVCLTSPLKGLFQYYAVAQFQVKGSPEI